MAFLGEDERLPRQLNAGGCILLAGRACAFLSLVRSRPIC
jgi:hypothetical protein